MDILKKTALAFLMSKKNIHFILLELLVNYSMLLMSVCKILQRNTTPGLSDAYMLCMCPFFMGGDGPRTFDRVVEFCDGWMPIAGRPGQEGSLAEKIALLRRQAREAGRTEQIPVSVYWMSRPQEDTAARMAEAGVDRLIFGLPSAQYDEVMPRMERCAELMA